MGTVSLPTLHFREGFTIDVAVRIANKLLLSPLRAWTILVVVAVQSVTRSSTTSLGFVQAVRATIQAAPHLVRSDRLVQAALAFLAFNVFVKANLVLSRAARNNFTRDPTGWKFGEKDGREIVLITGGQLL